MRTRILLLCLAVVGVVAVAATPHPAHATVANTTTTVTYTGSGGTEFAVPFGWISSGDLSVVKITIATSAESTLVEDTDYTVARVGSEGGTVTTTASVSSSFQIQITRKTPKTQTTNLRTQGRYLPSVVETAVDKLTMLVQEALSGVAQSEDTEQAITDHVASADDHTGYFQLAGRVTGQAGYGGTHSGDDLALYSTSHLTKGDINLAGVCYIDETNSRVGINDSTPSYALDITGNQYTTGNAYVAGTLYGTAASAGDLDITPNSDGDDNGYVKIDGDVLVVDAANDRVGIGNVSPSVELDVTGALAVSTTSSLVGDATFGGGAGAITATAANSSLVCLDNSRTGFVMGSSSNLSLLALDTTIGAAKIVVTGTTTVDAFHVDVGDAQFDEDVNVTLNTTIGGALDVTGDAGFDDTYTTGEAYGSKASGGNLDIVSTSHATKGRINLGNDTLVTDATNSRVGINDTTPNYALDVTGDIYATSSIYAVMAIYGGTASGGNLNILATSHATKGDVLIASFARFDDTNNRLGLNLVPSYTLDVAGDTRISGDIVQVSGDATIDGTIYGGDSASANLTLSSTSDATQGFIDLDDWVRSDVAQHFFTIDATENFTATKGTLNVIHNSATEAVFIFADGGTANNSGFDLWVGLDAPGAGGATNVYANLADGNGDSICTIENTNATTIAFVCPSDARLKKNIRPSRVQALATINAIPLRSFDWRDPEKGHVELGLVAQEVEPHWPQAVNEKQDGTKTLATSELVLLQMKAIQELTAQVEAMQQELDETHLRCIGAYR